MEEQLKENKMSIFGDLDTTQVPDDPFYVKPSTYWAICTEAVEKVSDKNGQVQCVITWTIDEPDNDFHGQSKQEYYSLFPGKRWEEYTPDEKKATTWFKRRLRRGFDLSESEVDSVQYSDLVGKGAFLTLKESQGKPGTENENRTFVNVADALCKRLYDEEKVKQGSASASLGL